MTFVMVVPEAGAWRLRTTMGNAIGPRLWGAEPANGLPPINDVFQTKDEAVSAAEIWNSYAHWCEQRSGKQKKKRWSQKN